MTVEEYEKQQAYLLFKFHDALSALRMFGEEDDHYIDAFADALNDARYITGWEWVEDPEWEKFVYNDRREQPRVLYGLQRSLERLEQKFKELKT